MTLLPAPLTVMPGVGSTLVGGLSCHRFFVTTGA